MLEAFRATLEEIKDSDLVVHLVDISHPGHAAQIDAVEGILAELGYGGIPRLLVFNKTDALTREELEIRIVGRDALGISALRGKGIESLLRRIDGALPARARSSARPFR